MRKHHPEDEGNKPRHDADESHDRNHELHGPASAKVRGRATHVRGSGTLDRLQSLTGTDPRTRAAQSGVSRTTDQGCRGRIIIRDEANNATVQVIYSPGVGNLIWMNP